MLLIRSLCEDAMDSKNYRDFIKPVFRLLHTVKGNAELFDLTIFKEFAAELEDDMGEIAYQPQNANVKQINAFVNKITKIENTLLATQAALPNLMQVQQGREDLVTATQAFVTNIAMMVEQLGQQYEKSVRFYYHKLDLESLPDNIYSVVTEISTQLISNAVIHGIENIQTRQERGKPITGKVCMWSSHSDSSYTIIIQDDGAGPNFDALRGLAEHRLKMPVNKIKKMKNKELVELMFESGITTAGDLSYSAGRGVGLDLVQQRVNEMHGELEFSYAAKQGSRFTIALPNGIDRE